MFKSLSKTSVDSFLLGLRDGQCWTQCYCCISNVSENKILQHFSKISLVYYQNYTAQRAHICRACFELFKASYKSTTNLTKSIHADKIQSVWAKIRGVCLKWRKMEILMHFLLLDFLQLC